MDYKDNKAVILSDCGKIKNCLLYKQVYEYCDLITNFILTYIKEPHQCIGLEMDHNIYIPSIVLSLQNLQHAFIFLPKEVVETELITKELGISWILSFNSNHKGGALECVTLNDQSLVLKHFSHNEFKTYKDIYYVIRTSGTTGHNKFVRVGKYSIESNINCFSKIFDIKESDVIYFGTPLTFDPSMIELLLAINNGACLLITTNKVSPTHLYQTLFHPENGVNFLQIVPSLFLRWSQNQIESILLDKKLKILAFGGECFPKSILRYKRSKSLRLFNLYGITEVSCWATIFEIPDEEIDDVPLGEALEDTLVEVRDFLGDKVTEGEGEIYIGSKKRICFVSGEPNQNEIFRATGDIAVVNSKGIFYKDRKIGVFKRLGHKVHLCKIEDLVEKETDLPNKCIWSKSESKLLLFLVIENFDKNIKNKFLDKIRIKLLHGLPKQYFPDYIDIIRKLPITSHGKTDRNALESLYLNRNHTNRATAEEIFKSLICENVGLTETQLTDLQKSTFFELGGNSILAIQILNEFKNETGSESPDLVAALFEKDIGACLECANLIKVRRKTDRVRPDNKILAKKFKNSVDLKVAWTYNLEACVDSTPLVFEHSGRILAAVGSFSHIFAVIDVANGAEVSKFHLPDVIEGTPCLSPCHNFLYIGCFDGHLYCLDFINKSKKWLYLANDRIKCKPVLCQDSTALVFGSYDKHIHCVKTEDGAPIWKTDVEESVICTPLVHKQKIHVATICGTCLCLSESAGEIFWKYKTGSPIFGTACIFNDVIVWPNVQGSLLSLTLDGRKILEFKCGGHLYSSLVVFKDSVIFGCNDGNLYIVKIDDGVLKMELCVNVGGALTTPCVYRDRVAVAGNSGRLFLIDFNGRLLSELRLPGEVFSSVVAHGNKLFLGCRDNRFYCIEANEI